VSWSAKPPREALRTLELDVPGNLLWRKDGPSAPGVALFRDVISG
jgi:hypothetical protein